MKILAILLSPPVPATAGHRLRNRSLLQALALEGHDVTMLAYATANEIAAPAADLQKLCRNFYFVPNPESSTRDRLLAAFGSAPYGAQRLTTPGMQRLVSEQLASNDFDALLCDDIYMAGNIPASSRIPVLLNKHDITCRIVRQFARSERNLFKKLYASLEARKIHSLEASVCSSAEAVAVCSAQDLEALREIAPSANMWIVPNVIDTVKYAPAPPSQDHTVLFVGAMDWLPNQDGAEFLVYDVMPRLRQLVPTANIVIAGRNPSEEMVRRFSVFPDVSFTGTVTDLRPYIARAAVCVAPLRIGSGTRLKILEAGAMAKPVVSTTLGAEGLDLRHGDEILLEDDPRQFAEAIALLLKEPQRAYSLGAALRAAVQKHYSIPALRTAFREMLGSTRRTANERIGSARR
jgi:glycosyltransferase involved in cell wall biosynthesis